MTALPYPAGVTPRRIQLGCMNLSHAYGVRPTEDEAGRVLNAALDMGVTMLDTAALYGNGGSERLIAKAVGHRRDEYLLASKGVLDNVDGVRTLDGRPEAIAASLDRSLQRLGVETIDLYYLHRFDKNVPIEDMVGAVARAVEAGKVRAIGLSEMSAPTLRRAYATHAIAAMQSEYNPTVRNPEVGVLETCKELGVDFVAFSPVGRGLLCGAVTDDNYVEGDLRLNMERFRQPRLAHNLKAVTKFNELAASLGLAPAQLSLAWVLAKGEHITAIPGTRTAEHLAEDLAAEEVTLQPGVVEQIEAIFAPGAIKGARYSKANQAQIDTELVPGEELAE